MASPSSMPRSPPLAPPSQRPFKHLPPAEEAFTEDTRSSASLSLNPSLLIISAIIAFVFIASAFIHLLLRLLSSRLRSSSVVAAAPPPPPMPPPPPISRRSDSHSSAADPGFSDKDKAALVDSLPLFSLASSLSVLPKSSPDCAVCLCPFRPHDELRLLPACRHAFHSQCVDPWLRSSPSCPLCRASIALPVAPLPSSPAPPPPPQDASTTGSFRIEIGSVSRRGTTSEADLTAGNHPRPLRTFSLGSSLEYIVDEEVEAVVAWIPRRTGKEEKRESSAEPEPPQPGAEVAEAAVGGGRGWLRDHVDRLATSASSTLSSLQFSGRWSHRYDGGEGGRWSRDLEGSARREAEEGGYYDFYRWLVGA